MLLSSLSGLSLKEIHSVAKIITRTVAFVNAGSVQAVFFSIRQDAFPLADAHRLGTVIMSDEGRFQ
jgi:hypothetical protein